MDDTAAHLGLPSVISQGADAGYGGEAEFRRLLRQIEIGAQAFNLDSSAVHMAAEIAAFEGELGLVPRLALIMLIVASMIALEEGSTRLPVTGDESRETMQRILTPLCGDAFREDGAGTIAGEIDRLLTSGAAAVVVGRSGEYKPLLYIPPFVFHQRIRAAELRLAESIGPRFKKRVADAPEKAVAGAISDMLARPVFLGGRKVAMSEEQRTAVVNAASSNLALISGGPGTGKTSTILAILRVLLRLGVKPGEVALAAPTGRAAFRMGESVRQGIAMVHDPDSADRLLAAACPESSTVHRLLGYSPDRGTFAHHRNNPLAASVVVIDESSMLDLLLTERLVASLRPEVRLIMLGDADQLPSVAAGAVFRDLVGAAEKRYTGICTRLTRSFRTDTNGEQGQAIRALTREINRGSIDAAEGGSLFIERATPGELQLEGVEFVNGSGTQLERFLERWYTARVSTDQIAALKNKVYSEDERGFDAAAIGDLRRIFDHFAASRILCVTRVLHTGADAINAGIHRRVANGASGSRERWGFLPGEPVMVVRNDYERMLFNGEQGIVVKVAAHGGREALKAVFIRDGDYLAFDLAALRESLELCYASTIHKAQGSEFDEVAIVLPEQDVPILTRELLYTGVSRARRSVVICGNISLLRAGVAHKGTRHSGLGDLLPSPAEGVEQLRTERE